MLSRMRVCCSGKCDSPSLVDHYLSFPAELDRVGSAADATSDPWIEVACWWIWIRLASISWLCICLDCLLYETSRNRSSHLIDVVEDILDMGEICDMLYSYPWTANKDPGAFKSAQRNWTRSSVFWKRHHQDSGSCILEQEGPPKTLRLYTVIDITKRSPCFLGMCGGFIFDGSSWVGYTLSSWSSVVPATSNVMIFGMEELRIVDWRLPKAVRRTLRCFRHRPCGIIINSPRPNTKAKEVSGSNLYRENTQDYMLSFQNHCAEFARPFRGTFLLTYDW